MRIQITQFIDAGHQLKDTPDLVTKQCCNLHGHTYKIMVSCDTNVNPKSGLTVDFKGIKDIIKELDHKFINDVFKKNKYFKDKNSTAENIALYYQHRIKNVYPFVDDLQIIIYEGYKGEEHTSIIKLSDVNENIFSIC